MSLIKSGNMFDEAAFPIAVDRVKDRLFKELKLHRHEYYEILFVEQGTLTCQFKGVERVMKPGDVLIMKPYVLHMLKDAVTNKASTAYYCSFLPQIVDYKISGLEDLADSDSPNGYYCKSLMPLAETNIAATIMKLGSKRIEPLSAAFKQLKMLSHENNERSNALARITFLELMSFLSRNIEEGVTVGKIKVDTTQSHYLADLRKTLNYIHDHFDQPLTVDAMAEMCGATKSYFCRLFKRETGMTFVSYLNYLCIERACALFRNSSDPALDICYRVGFNNYPHFNRQFKSHTDMSPSEFRKKKLIERNGMISNVAVA